MTLRQAVKLLSRHQGWRRGLYPIMEMVNSKELGIAIDIILEEVKKHIHEPISKNQVTKILECGVNNTGFKRVGKKEG